MKKILLSSWIFIIIVIGIANAGQMGQNEHGFYYIQDDGTFAKSKWITMDLDADGYDEYYYFNEACFMVLNGKTADGYDVNGKGQWIKNGVVQKIKSEKNNGIKKSNVNNSGYMDNTIKEYKKGIDDAKSNINKEVDKAAKDIKDELGILGGLYGGYVDKYADIYKDALDKTADIYKDTADSYGDMLNDMMKKFGY